MLRSKFVIGVSTPIVKNLKRVGIPESKLTLIHNGIDVAKISKTTSYDIKKNRQILKLRDESFVVGTLGRLVTQKDHKTLINTASEVIKEKEDCDFIVAGEGPLRTELATLTEYMKISHRFHFIGYHEDVAPLLKLMDIFVITSLDEGLPIAMLEAMAARVPIVATAVGAIPTVIRDGDNGILFKEGNGHQLKKIIISLMDNPKRRAVLAQRGFDTVDTQFSNNTMTEKYMVIYNKSLNER